MSQPQLVLRDYQEACRQAVRAECARQQAEDRSRPPSVVVVSPTGSGKTVMGAAFAVGAVGRGLRALWIAGRRELLNQAYETFGQVTPFETSVIAPGSTRYNPLASIQIASIDTLRARNMAPPAEVVIWDECHHVAAKTWTDFSARYPKAIHLGLTATPERADGKPLSGSFRGMVVAVMVGELIARGYLVPCEVIAPPAAQDGSDIAMDPLEAWQAHADGRCTVIFCATVAHALGLEERFRAAGVPCGVVHGAMPVAARSDVVARFKSGAILVLLNVNVLTEGFDHRPTAVCMIARPCGSAGQFLQMVGRVLRPYPGKDKATLIDLRGAVWKHGMPDEDREFSLDGGMRRKAAASRTPLRTCPTCDAVFPMASVCPRCGHRFERPEEPTVAGVGIEAVRALREEQALVDDYNDLLIFALSRGFKEGWAAHEFKRKHGQWPLHRWSRIASIRKAG